MLIILVDAQSHQQHTMCTWVDSAQFNFTSGPAAVMFCWDRQPDYSAYRESSFGHGIIEVKNETHAQWTWHRNQDLYASAKDEIYIVRQPDKCPVKPIMPLDFTD